MTLGSRRVRLVLAAVTVTAIAALQPIAAQTPAPDPMKPRLLQLTVVTFKFSSVTTSPLKYDVVLGENEIDIDLDKFVTK